MASNKLLKQFPPPERDLPPGYSPGANDSHSSIDESLQSSRPVDVCLHKKRVAARPFDGQFNGAPLLLAPAREDYFCPQCRSLANARSFPPVTNATLLSEKGQFEHSDGLF